MTSKSKSVVLTLSLALCILGGMGVWHARMRKATPPKMPAIGMTRDTIEKTWGAAASSTSFTVTMDGQTHTIVMAKYARDEKRVDVEYDGTLTAKKVTVIGDRE